LLYMPSALPGISAGKVAELLQQTDRLIKTVPEVASVFGKAGRADTATDPAPLEMFETTIQFKPQNQWRPVMTPDKLFKSWTGSSKCPADQRLGATDSQSHRHAGDWNQDSRGRQGGGYKLARDWTGSPRRLSARQERPWCDVRVCRTSHGRPLHRCRHQPCARRSLRAQYCGRASLCLLGDRSDNIGQTIEDWTLPDQRALSARTARTRWRKLRDLPVLTERGAQIRLGDVAEMRVSDGPPMLKSENARLSSWVYIDLHGRALSSAVRDMQHAVARQVRLPAGYSLSWSGQLSFWSARRQDSRLSCPRRS